MNKYRIYAATYSYTMITHSSIASVFDVILPVAEGDHDFVLLGTYNSFDDATAAAGTEGKTFKIVKRDRPVLSTYSDTMWFDSDAQARRWLTTQVESRGHDHTSTQVTHIDIDGDDLEAYRHTPVYSVTLNVIKTVQIEVEIDSSDHDDIDDEYDAGERAKQMAEDGELDHEIQYGDFVDQDVEVEYTEEQ